MLVLKLILDLAVGTVIHWFTGVSLFLQTVHTIRMSEKLAHGTNRDNVLPRIWRLNYSTEL